MTPVPTTILSVVTSTFEVLNVVAVTTPALPNFIILPTSTKSSTSANATLRPAECKSDVPVLKLLAVEIPDTIIPVSV